MSEDRTGYGTRPAQFRLPFWAHEFLALESAGQGVSKTEVVLRALDSYRRDRLNERLGLEYAEMAAEDRAESRVWESTSSDGLEPEEW
jgi:hypothetical protein